MNRSGTAYKAGISIGFGLIGFFLNFHAIHFSQFAAFKVSILPGLLFPLLISLVWGWRYGLVSALAGGCQSMWWIWSSDGFGAFYSVPVFTAWVVWHGAWADYRKKQPAVRWYYSMYTVEIGFRLLSEAGFYTLFRWLISLNPPPWNPDIVWDHVAWSWVHFVAAKHVITAYLLLLIAHVVLRLGPTRRFFGLRPMSAQRSTTHVVCASILTGALFWVFDTTVVFFAFNEEGRSFLNALTVGMSPRDLFVRNSYLLICLIAGLSVSHVLSERYRKEQDLESTRKLLGFAIEQMPIPVIIADAPNVDIRWINSEAERLLAKPTDNPLDITLEEQREFWPTFYPDGRPYAVDELPLTRAVQKGETSTHVEVIVKRGPETRWISANAAPLKDESGDILAGIVVFPDITEKKQAEAQIRALNEELDRRVKERTRKLEAAHEELEDFVYSVSHDLRAPLRSISGFSQIIERRHKEALNDEGRHYFGNIIKASRQMGLLIEDLLKFSRLGRKGVDLMSLSLGDLVNEAIDLLRDPIADTGAVLRISEGLPRVRGDRLLALQVLVNLLDNALKYTIPDTPPFVEIHAEEASDGVLLSVSDRGIGIPPEYHEKVFKIFQRLHHESEYPGTGVGLASVKKAASIMGCNVRVESAQGKGATFTVRFPADTPQSNAAY